MSDGLQDEVQTQFVAEVGGVLSCGGECDELDRSYNPSFDKI